MLPPRRIVGCFFRLGLLYGLLVLPWPGVRAGYAAFFSAGGNCILRSLVPGTLVRFRPLSSPVETFDTHVRYLNLRSGATSSMLGSSQKLGYLPTAFVFSLVLVTPLPWRRRLWALLWALILITLFIAGGQFVVVLHTFSHPPLSLFHPSPAWDSVLALGRYVAINGVVTWFMVPVLIWGVVCFRQTDWAKWVQKHAQPPVHRDPHLRPAASRQGSSRRRRARRPRRSPVARPG